MGVTRRPVEMLRRLIGGGAGVHRIRLRLAASVFLLIFVKLALIRWLGATGGAENVCPLGAA